MTPCLHCRRDTNSPPVCPACLAAARSEPAGLVSLPGPKLSWVDLGNGDYAAEENPGVLATRWAEFVWCEGIDRHRDSSWELFVASLDVTVEVPDGSEVAMLSWCAAWLTERVGARWDDPGRARQATK